MVIDGIYGTGTKELVLAKTKELVLAKLIALTQLTT
jgi:hypothetical protein